MLSNIDDLFRDSNLDDEEMAIEEAIERGEYIDAPDFEGIKKILNQAVRTKKVNILNYKKVQ